MTPAGAQTDHLTAFKPTKWWPGCHRPDPFEVNRESLKERQHPPSLPRSLTPLPRLWSGGRLWTNAVIYHPRQGSSQRGASAAFIGLVCCCRPSGWMLFGAGRFEKPGKWGFPTRQAGFHTEVGFVTTRLTSLTSVDTRPNGQMSLWNWDPLKLSLAISPLFSKTQWHLYRFKFLEIMFKMTFKDHRPRFDRCHFIVSSREHHTNMEKVTAEHTGSGLGSGDLQHQKLRGNFYEINAAKFSQYWNLSGLKLHKNIWSFVFKRIFTLSFLVPSLTTGWCFSARNRSLCSPQVKRVRVKRNNGLKLKESFKHIFF